MVLRFTLTGLIAPVMVLARITQRLQMAKETCVRSGGA